MVARGVREKCKVWTEPWPGRAILAWHVQGLGSTSSNTEERGREEKEVKKERREGVRERGRAGRQAGRLILEALV